MTASRLCQTLTKWGHETIPPACLDVLCAAQKLALQGLPITIARLSLMTGCAHRSGVQTVVDRLIAAGLLRHEGYGQTGLAVACVFIPGERR